MEALVLLLCSRNSGAWRAPIANMIFNGGRRRKTAENDSNTGGNQAKSSGSAKGKLVEKANGKRAENRRNEEDVTRKT